VEGPFAPSERVRRKGNIVRGQGRILYDLRRGHLGAVPIGGEPEKIERMGLYLAGGPQEERLVDVERLAGERNETPDDDQRQDEELDGLSGEFGPRREHRIWFHCAP
jgi:hypothetical protein